MAKTKGKIDVKELERDADELFDSNIDEKPNSENTDVAIVEDADDLIDSVFARQINSAPPKFLTFKRTLTRGLVSMSKTERLAVECEGEMYVLDLPLKGRTPGTSACRVVDVKNIITGESSILILHEMMVSALERGAFRVLVQDRSTDGEVSYKEKIGTPLNGHRFAFVSGNIVADKGYRVVSCVELE